MEPPPPRALTSPTPQASGQGSQLPGRGKPLLHHTAGSFKAAKAEAWPQPHTWSVTEPDSWLPVLTLPSVPSLYSSAPRWEFLQLSGPVQAGTTVAQKDFPLSPASHSKQPRDISPTFLNVKDEREEISVIIKYLVMPLTGNTLHKKQTMSYNNWMVFAVPLGSAL